MNNMYLEKILEHGSISKKGNCYVFCTPREGAIFSHQTLSFLVFKVYRDKLQLNRAKITDAGAKVSNAISRRKK